ncbi:MAG: hypothetical protein V2A58_14605 [Planctomycetota bacterium]
MTVGQERKQLLSRPGLAARKTFRARDVDITFLTFEIEGPAFRAQLLEALAECDRVVGLANVARQTFFLSQDLDRSQLVPVVEEAYAAPLPATTFVCQPPAGGAALSCELWAFSSEATLQRRRHVTTAFTPSATWGFVGGMETDETEPPAKSLARMLSEANQELHRAGLSLSHMVRTWYYIGEILGDGEKDSPYERFNAARNELYRTCWPDLVRSPASTGIGMRSRRIAFEGLFLSHGGNGCRLSWIDNPLQTPPHLYARSTKAACNPSFSRAAAVRFADAALLFISGTASIRGSEVIAPDDPEAQTKITIENIATLLGKDNLVDGHGLPRGATLEDLLEFRVYLKRPGDLDVVRVCCQRFLPAVPHTYLVADVCRPEFLVEIEGVAALANGA